MAKKEITHAELVRKLMKSGNEIYDEMTPFRCELTHMAIGIAGEAGELLDAVKKHVIYNDPINMVNVIEELGDIEFFLEGIRQLLKIERQECLDENIRKLSIRYGELTYSDKAAQQRADKTMESSKT